LTGEPGTPRLPLTHTAKPHDEINAATKPSYPFAIADAVIEERDTEMAAIASFKAMFCSLGFSEAAAGQLSSEDGEGLNFLENIKALNDDCARAVCKAVRRPGGAGDGHAVSKRAEHNLMICTYVINLWIRTSRDSRTVLDLVIVPDTLFTRAQRQKELEASWDNAEHLHVFARLKSSDLRKGSPTFTIILFTLYRM